MKIPYARPTRAQMRQHLTVYATDLIQGSYREASNIERIMEAIGKRRKDFYKAFGSIEEMVNESFQRWLEELGNMPDPNYWKRNQVSEKFFSDIDDFLGKISPVYWAILKSEIESDPILEAKLMMSQVCLSRMGYTSERFNNALVQLKV